MSEEGVEEPFSLQISTFIFQVPVTISSNDFWSDVNSLPFRYFSSCQIVHDFQCVDYQPGSVAGL